MNGIVNVCIANNFKNLNLLNHISEFSTFRNNIDIINGDFETMNLQILHKIDLIFINFEELFFSKETSKIPDKMHKILQKSLTITKNIVILFPKTLKISSLAELFCSKLEIYKES